jgi:hypothetical protein
MFNSSPFNRIIYNRRAGTSYRFHPILEAEYFEESPQVNRSFVAGVDLSGSTVTGNASTSAESALVGERLDVRHDTAVTSAAAAGYAASAVLAKARLDGRRAKVTIPPHCGLELWDVVSIVDIPANQATAYRVNGYTLDIDFKQAKYQHQCELCAL